MPQLASNKATICIVNYKTPDFTVRKYNRAIENAWK
jgi:hypothetical protein